MLLCATESLQVNVIKKIINAIIQGFSKTDYFICISNVTNVKRNERKFL